ncbi:MAG: hypothetical protein ACI9FU_000931 [Granulosicoccus sp.]|jgi:hypothetical protein
MRLFVSLILSFAVSITVTFAQDYKVETVAFTGEKAVSFDFRNKSVYYSLVGDSAKLEIKFNYSGEFNTVVNAGTEFMLKTEGDKVLKLKTSKPVFPVTSLMNTAIISQYTYSISLTPENLGGIAESTLLMMRHPDSKGGTTDVEFKERAKKWGKSIVDGAQFLLGNMK